MVQLCKALVGPTGRVLVTAGGAKSVQHIKTTLGVHDSEIIRYRGATVEEMVAAVEAANAGHKVRIRRAALSIECECSDSRLL